MAWNEFEHLTKKLHSQINETKYAYASCDPQSWSFFFSLSHSACKHDIIILFHASPVAQLCQTKSYSIKFINRKFSFCFQKRWNYPYRKSSIKPAKNVRKLLLRLMSVPTSNLIWPKTFWSTKKQNDDVIFHFGIREMFRILYLHSDNRINEKQHCNKKTNIR